MTRCSKLQEMNVQCNTSIRLPPGRFKSYSRYFPYLGVAKIILCILSIHVTLQNSDRDALKNILPNQYKLISYQNDATLELDTTSEFYEPT